MLQVRDVAVAFNGVAVLNGVDLDVATGEICCLTGPSGSGKSTLLRVIAGLQVADRGTVAVDGQDVTALPPHRRGIGLVFQDHGLFPHLDVSGNVGFSLRTRGVGSRLRAVRVEELLGLMGLEEFGSRRVSTLSGGEQQRVALARALAAAPRVLLLDEPLGALDPSIHDRLAVDLRALLRGAGTTALLVTHDEHEAALIGDRSVDIRHLSPGMPTSPVRH